MVGSNSILSHTGWGLGRGGIWHDCVCEGKRAGCGCGGGCRANWVVWVRVSVG